MKTTETLDIEQIIGDMLRTDDSEHADALFAEVVGATGLELRHDALLAPYVERPAEMLAKEANNLFKANAGRVLLRAIGTETYEEMVTRTPNFTAIDGRYRRKTITHGEPVITIASRLRSTLELPCKFVIAGGAIEITEPKYERGMYHDAPSRRGEMLTRALATDMVWAAAQTRERHVQGIAGAHNRHAQQLLRVELKQERGKLI